MLRRLFARLTTDPRRGEALFGAVVRAARDPAWYRDGGVPDTIDGRFAMLSTLVALAAVRLEALGVDGDEASVALTERFVEAMEEEHRQLGVGDPTLGKTVRSLVGALAGRVQLWRETVASDDWREAAERSLFRGHAPSGEALGKAESGLHLFWASIGQRSAAELYQGKLE